MITIYCALYPEAQELIHIYGMKKETGRCHFQTFSNMEKDVRLVITGTGNAAMPAVAELSSVYPPGESDFLVNFGSCGASGSLKQEICLCNKITQSADERSFYPDILYRHPFREAEIITVSRPLKNGEITKGVLCDMEAAFVYQSGIYYYGPHQMIFLKAVTDYGQCDRQEFERIMKVAAQNVAEYLLNLNRISGEPARTYNSSLQDAKEDAGKLGEELSCSATMQAELTQLLIYLRLAGKDYASMIEAYRKRLPCKRREGKKILEELRSELL